ncbi:pyridoxamine 5'-phosphate oxidase family protein [Pseudolactococcus yaeyamensis]
MSQEAALLKEAGVYFVATVDGDQPKLRPFGVINEFEGKVYLATSNDKAVFAQFIANPKVQLSANLPNKWFRIKGKLVQDARDEAKQSFLDHNERLKEIYSGEPFKHLEVLYLTDVTTTVYES